MVDPHGLDREDVLFALTHEASGGAGTVLHCARLEGFLAEIRVPRISLCSGRAFEHLVILYIVGSLFNLLPGAVIIFNVIPVKAGIRMLLEPRTYFRDAEL